MKTWLTGLGLSFLEAVQYSCFSKGVQLNFLKLQLPLVVWLLSRISQLRLLRRIRAKYTSKYNLPKKLDVWPAMFLIYFQACTGFTCLKSAYLQLVWDMKISRCSLLLGLSIVLESEILKKWPVLLFSFSPLGKISRAESKWANIQSPFLSMSGICSWIHACVSGYLP